MQLPSAEAVIGRRTIIVGDVNTGKTRASLQLAGILLSACQSDMVILDFAPETTRGIGGKMIPESMEGVEYLTAEIIPPRLTAKTPVEVEAYARVNVQRIEAMLQAGLARERQVAIINDVSIYLQGAEVEALLQWLGRARTSVINGYFGKTFDDSDFSRRERSRMETLMSRCHEVIRL